MHITILWKNIGSNSYTLILFKQKLRWCFPLFPHCTSGFPYYTSGHYLSKSYLHMLVSVLSHGIQKTKEHIVHKWSFSVFYSKKIIYV